MQTICTQLTHKLLRNNSHLLLAVSLVLDFTEANGTSSPEEPICSLRYLTLCLYFAIFLLFLPNDKIICTKMAWIIVLWEEIASWPKENYFLHMQFTYSNKPPTRQVWKDWIIHIYVSKFTYGQLYIYSLFTYAICAVNIKHFYRSTFLYFQLLRTTIRTVYKEVMPRNNLYFIYSNW